MASMSAYLDDFGKISIWLNKNFYGGRTDNFWLIGPGGNINELIVSGVEEHENSVRYDLIAPANMHFGVDYQVRETHGLIQPLKVRLIVNTDEFNRMFYYDGTDLGNTYHAAYTDFALWAPTAVTITLQVKNHGTIGTYAMRRSEKGVWRVRVNGDLQHATYVYLIERNGKVVRSLDPYALSSTGNAWESAVIDLEKINTVTKVTPTENHATGVDAVIYETSVRDMTANPFTGTRTHGKYSSLCEEGTTYKDLPTGLSYLSQLGVTHVQLLPVHDFVTVDEFHPNLNYNWGYDPMQYLSLEGSYSDDPDNPYARMMEFRTLVKKMHEHNMKVNMDVVFNHTYGVDESCFHATVPYYYYRYNSSGFLSNGTFCGNDFASEAPMARKYLIHVLRTFIELYDVDGFRFDLMGILDVDTMNAIRTSCSELKNDVMIYGEGWDLPTVLDWTKKANIYNQNKMPEIGHFNDYFRDVVKGKTSDDQKYERGYVTGDMSQAFSMLSALSANVMAEPLFRRFESPVQSINNIETHDNSTVWDKMHACCGNEDRETRRKRQKMMILSLFVAQGVPFMHAGLEFCGTKDDHSNSYNAGDNINQMNWERAIYYRDVIEYTKKAIALRKKYSQFRFHTTQEIYDHVKLSETDFGIVFYDINMADTENDCNVVRVLFNPSFDGRHYDFEPGWRVIFDENGDTHAEENSHVYLPPLSAIVLARK